MYSYKIMEIKKRTAALNPAAAADTKDPLGVRNSAEEG